MIDGMLTVDVNKRLTLEECMAHPWMHGHSSGRIPHTGVLANPNDSTGGLVGGIADMDFEKRRVTRERTLLATINDVLVAKHIELQQDGKGKPVAVFVKNPGKERLVNRKGEVEGKGKENVNGVTERVGEREVRPDAERQVKEFERMGGRGDQVLFEDDPRSIYPGKDVAEVRENGR